VSVARLEKIQQKIWDRAAGTERKEVEVLLLEHLSSTEWRFLGRQETEAFSKAFSGARVLNADMGIPSGLRGRREPTGGDLAASWRRDLVPRPYRGDGRPCATGGRVLAQRLNAPWNVGTRSDLRGLWSRVRPLFRGARERERASPLGRAVGSGPQGASRRFLEQGRFALLMHASAAGPAELPLDDEPGTWVGCCVIRSSHAAGPCRGSPGTWSGRSRPRRRTARACRRAARIDRRWAPRMACPS